jgi:hypothetical protein
MKITKTKLKQIILEEVQQSLDLGSSGIGPGDHVMIKLDPEDSMINIDEEGRIDNSKLEWVRNKSEGEWDYSGVNTLRLFRRYRDENFYGPEKAQDRNIGEVIKREGDNMVQVGFRDQDGKPVVIIKLNADLLEPAPRS